MKKNAAVEKKEGGVDHKKIRIIKIDSADQLQTLINAPVICEFGLDNNIIRIPVQRMTPATADLVREIRRKAQPPFKKDRLPNGDYDYFDQNYLKMRDENDRKARALVIYAHCPTVSGSKPGMTNVDDISKHVQGMFTENILEMIAMTIQGGGMDLEGRVNFTSTPASES